MPCFQCGRLLISLVIKISAVVILRRHSTMRRLTVAPTVFVCSSHTLCWHTYITYKMRCGFIYSTWANIWTCTEFEAMASRSCSVLTLSLVLWNLLTLFVLPLKDDCVWYLCIAYQPYRTLFWILSLMSQSVFCDSQLKTQKLSIIYASCALLLMFFWSASTYRCVLFLFLFYSIVAVVVCSCWSLIICISAYR